MYQPGVGPWVVAIPTPAGPVSVMGIVNRTRDSFFDAGATFSLSSATAAVRACVQDGADWIDIGAVPFSARAETVTEDEEIRRIVPLVEIAREYEHVTVSVDTQRSRVARAALESGAHAVNDTSGLHDPEMIPVLVETGAKVIITHSRVGTGESLQHPTYTDVVAEVVDFLRERAGAAVRSGVPIDNIVVDPGHDLNKNTLHSLELTRRLSDVSALGYPVLVSVSNKDFIGEALGVPKEERRVGTVASLVMCVLGGATILRVHDVLAARQAVEMVETIMGTRPPRYLSHNYG